MEVCRNAFRNLWYEYRRPISIYVAVEQMHGEYSCTCGSLRVVTLMIEWAGYTRSRNMQLSYAVVTCEIKRWNYFISHVTTALWSLFIFVSSFRLSGEYRPRGVPRLGALLLGPVAGPFLPLTFWLSTKCSGLYAHGLRTFVFCEGCVTKR